MNSTNGAPTAAPEVAAMDEPSPAAMDELSPAAMDEPSPAAMDEPSPAAMDEPSPAAQSAIEVNPVTPLPEEGNSTGLDSNGDSTRGPETGLPGHEDGDGEESTLERASQLFEKGSKAIEAGDFVDAVDSLSRALEIRVANYGELAPECASSYYKYGCALLYKAQDETDPLGNVLKNSPKYSTEDTAVNIVEASSSSMLSSALNKHSSSPDINDLEGGSGDKNEEDEIDGCKEDDEELGEAEEDDSDLDFAWKMLDIARAIYERSPDNSFEKVNVFAALGEVSMEREDLETSLSDFRRALDILEHLVEQDNRRVVELNFRICLALELGSKFEEAITYCEKAISLCKSRLERLKVTSAKSKDSEETGVISLNNLDKAAPELSSEPSVLDGEIDVLSSILTDLEKKLEDLQQLMTSPKSILTELLRRTVSDSRAAEKNAARDLPASPSINSSQMAVMETRGFDSTASTAATDGVRHLGVVGRGIKRAVVASADEEPASPNKSFKLPVESEENCGSSIK